VDIPGLRIESLSEIAWRATRRAGIYWLPLHLDESVGGANDRRGGGTVLIRMDPGCGYAAHRHVGSEDVLVLQGSYLDDRGEHRQGSFVHYPPGSSHSPVAGGDRGRDIGPANPACILYVVTRDGIELLEEREPVRDELPR
jgi:anti-sigma factor ChrR (cupin superfamily)